MQCTTMAEAEATPVPAKANPFAKYQSYKVQTPPKPDTRGYRQQKHQAAAKLTREERNALPPSERTPIRGLGKHWEERRFTATFKGISYRWNARTMKQDQYLDLTDVYMDGLLFTMNWSMPLIPRMMGLFSHDGETVTFEAQINRTGHAAREAGQPVLRHPFRKLPD